MEKRHTYLKAMANVLLYLVDLVLLITVFPKLFVFFMPFIIGWIISAIANPLVRFFERKVKFKRKAGSVIVIVLVIALIITIGYWLVYFLVTQGTAFAMSLPEKWPEWQKELNEWGQTFNSYTKNLPADTRDSLNNIGSSLEDTLHNVISNAGTPAIETVSGYVKSVPAAIVSVVIGILSAYFFTVEHDNLSAALKKYAPKSLYEKLMVIYNAMIKGVGGYFKAQLKIEVWVYLIIVVGLMIIRVDYALIIALGIAFLDFLPVFGAGIIMIPWTAVFFFRGSYFEAIGMLVTWLVGQLVRQIIQPKYVSESMGLPALPTLILLYVGFMVDGMAGMIFAVPIGMIFYSLYEGGLFKSFTDSVKILWNGFETFRRLTPEDTGEQPNENVGDVKEDETL